MSPRQEPIEPDYVIDSTARTPQDRVRSAANRAYSAASTSAQSVRRAASGSRLIESTETKVNELLGRASHAIDDAVRTGKVDRVFAKAQHTVSSGAQGARKLFRRR
ncbi:hypothetical protein DFO66_106113 [Brevibacterium sanguinis]|uniref:Uncharacterized protein n=2 Tax=Brevibacterium TaxID=1696 RepID=A0A366IIF5_9MICO|nr:MULTISPECIES: hypothetical protein [Brevibacterium]RBP64714.1 hypothetical protein DFO66_106113 [Brevibacterium sanguinis]RBP71643.1 hypothetical protein DFO65_105248 [Brevibacterium celere]